MIIRYISILRRFISTSFSAQAEYKFNFIIELFAMMGTFFGSILMLSLFFKDGQTLGSWTWYEALIVQGFYTFFDGFTNTFLRPNLREIVNYVRDGSLDLILVKPIDSQFWVSLRTFSPSGIPEIFLGLSLIFWSVSRLDIIIPFYIYGLCFYIVLCSLIILYSIWFFISATTIWFVKTWNATEVLRTLLAAGRYPINSYPFRLRFVFTFLIPISFLTTVPSEIILGRFTSLDLFLVSFYSFMFFNLSRRFWMFALRFYTSASS